MKPIRPISELGNRVQEAGRLRMGEKHGRAMRSLDKWRLTSPHKDCLDQIAGIYGGEPRPWSDPKATTKDQFELYTETDRLRVAVPPGGMSQFYELWAGSGCVRRCDGINAVVPDPRTGEAEVPCLCDRNQDMECKPYTRLSVVLPEITFRGVWRLETKSWSAADEMPAMEQMIDSLQAQQMIIEAELLIQQRSRITKQGKRNFVVPVLNLTQSPQALASGQTGIGVELEAPTPAGELNAGDDEPVEAELLFTQEDLPAEARRIANLEMLDPSKFLRALCLGASEGEHEFPTDLSDEQVSKAADFLSKVIDGSLIVSGFNNEGRMMVSKGVS